MRKRQRTEVQTPSGGPNDPQIPPAGAPQPVTDDAFINDNDAVDSGGDDDDEDDKPKADKKGRRKIKIEFIQDKSRRHITFSKRKAGIMKKAYELSTLTGTQVLLLVVSETGLVYTFTTAKLQPLVTQPEGKNLIQACLNAPHGSLPSSMPVGTPLGRSSGPMGMPGAPPANMPGGLSIGQTPGGAIKDDEDGPDDDEAAHGGRASVGDKRRRRESSTNANPSGATSNVPNTRSGSGGAVPPSPHSPNSTIPPLSIPPGGPPSSGSAGPPPLPMGASPTSPPQGHSQVPSAGQGQYGSQSYGQHHGQPQQGPDGAMYSPAHMMPPGGYPYAGGQSGQGGQQQLGGLAAAAAAQHGHWGPPPQQQQQQQVGQGGHYGRR